MFLRFGDQMSHQEKMLNMYFSRAANYDLCKVALDQ